MQNVHGVRGGRQADLYLVGNTKMQPISEAVWRLYYDTFLFVVPVSVLADLVRSYLRGTYSPLEMAVVDRSGLK